jgi:UDP:flavonoid glycosyltransferase YjiC (YdhE family)
MRVLVSGVPAIGHIVPMLDLAQSLQKVGHDVRFATNSERHGVISVAGLQPLEAGMSLAEMRRERLRRWPETDRQPASVWATRMWAQIMAPSTLRGLLAIMADWLPDVVLHDEGEYAGPVAAAKSNVPWVTHSWGSPLRPTSELADLEELTAALWMSSGFDVPVFAGLYEYALVDPCPRLLQSASPGTRITWPIRPMPFDDDGELLEADAYVGFGTVPAFATALAELTSAVRTCTERGMRVVVTAPSENLRHELAAIDRDLVRPVEFVNLSALLSSCKVAITHAGAGTVLASLGAGVPLVLVPRGARSQLRMAQACETAGVGRSCAGREGIDTAVSDVLSNPAIAANARSASLEIAAMPSGAEVAAKVEELVTSHSAHDPRQRFELGHLIHHHHRRVQMCPVSRRAPRPGTQLERIIPLWMVYPTAAERWK